MFVTYRINIFKNTGNQNPVISDEEPPITEMSMSSPLVFDSVNKKYYFLPVNDSSSFGTVDYDAQMKTKTNYSNDEVFKFFTMQQLNTLHYICDSEKKQSLTI